MITRSYKQWIEEMRRAYIGKRVLFDCDVYTVVDVDYNGCLLIDKKAEFTDLTAIPALGTVLLD